MDYELIKTFILAANMALTIILAVSSWNGRKQRATAKSIDELNKKYEEKCQRLAKLEGELKAMPTRDELARIHFRIDEIIENSRQNNLLLGQVLGQLKQINEGR